MNGSYDWDEFERWKTRASLKMAALIIALSSICTGMAFFLDWVGAALGLSELARLFIIVPLLVAVVVSTIPVADEWVQRGA
jgi:hypothetical protein